MNYDEHQENTSSTTEPVTNEFSEWWSKQKQLKKRIQKTCEKFGPSLRKTIDRHDLMYDHQHELLFCRSAKVSALSSHCIVHHMGGDNLKEPKKYHSTGYQAL